MAAYLDELKAIVRANARQPWSAMMKLIGFVIGFVGCMLILAFVNFETGYDAWISHADRMVRVVQIQDVATGTRSVSPPYPLADAARSDLPGVVGSVRMQPLRAMLQQGQLRYNEHILFVEPSFLDLFEVKAEGNPRPLDQPLSVVLSRSAAKKYFGIEDAQGKTLLLGGKHAATVTAIMPDWPKDSHLSPDVLMPLESFFQIANKEAGIAREMLTGWDNCQCYPTYLLLDHADRFDEVNASLPDLLVRKQGKEYAEQLPLFLQPVRDAYLGSTDYRTYLDHARKGNPVQLMVFLAIAFVLLIISGVNFANFSVAEATRRAKEFGVRRILGANRGAVYGRLLAESGLLTAVALLLSLVIAWLLLESFANFLGKPLTAAILFSVPVMAQVLGTAILAALAAGSVSALLLARASPIALLRENPSMEGRLLSGGSVRQMMIMLQLLISTMLIIGSIAIYSQISYVRSMPRGYVSEDKVVVNGEGSHEGFGEIRARLAALPTVTSVSIANAVPTTSLPNAVEMVRQGGGATEVRSTVVIDADFEMLPALEVKPVAGRLFDPQFGADSYYADDSTQVAVNVVVNKTGARELGFSAPESAIGQIIRYADPEESSLAMHIVGVVEDIRYGSPREAVVPMVYRARVDWNINHHELRYFLVTSRDPSSPELHSAIAALWTTQVPGVVSDSVSMTSRLSAQLDGEEQQFRIVFLFTIASLFVSVLGVLGLAAFVMRRRARELAIRRVLGASKLQVAALVSFQQMPPILLAVLLSIPCIYWLILRWLENFNLRVSLSWTWFVSGAMLSSLSALLILLLFSLRVTSTSSPVSHLKGA